MRTLIIAEVGVNHNGSLPIAMQLIEVAADAGADLVKFQTFNADRLVTGNAPKARYQIENDDARETQHEMLRRLELSREAHLTLIAHCGRHGIGFLSTGFDIESVDLLCELGVDRLKVPSGEMTNLPFLRHIGRARKPIILSTGMSTMTEIEGALAVLERAGAARDQITVLHCNTEYPTPPEDVNLRAMLSIRDEFGVEVGYSDHTLGIEVAVAAVALGARVIEKHFTLDRSLPGPDHKASLEPDELVSLVRAIRNVERAMGDGVKRPSPSEIRNREIARRSIVAGLPIAMGQEFSEANLATKRPGTGISPMRWDELIGLRATRDYDVDDLIEP